MGAAAEDVQTDTRGRVHESSSPINKQTWDELDLGGQGLHALSPVLFDAYRFVKRLDLNFNNITYLPPAIGQLKALEHLDLSHNSLSELPPEIGMLTNLTHLLLFENRIQTLCYELGFLFRLQVLGVLGNPLEDGQKNKISDGGTRALISHLRESMPGKSF
jgi:CCR4-NOT transcription complex subunit 6